MVAAAFGDGRAGSKDLKDSSAVFAVAVNAGESDKPQLLRIAGVEVLRVRRIANKPDFSEPLQFQAKYLLEVYRAAYFFGYLVAEKEEAGNREDSRKRGDCQNKARDLMLLGVPKGLLRVPQRRLLHLPDSQGVRPHRRGCQQLQRRDLQKSRK